MTRTVSRNCGTRVKLTLSAPNLAQKVVFNEHELSSAKNYKEQQIIFKPLNAYSNIICNEPILNDCRSYELISQKIAPRQRARSYK